MNVILLKDVDKVGLRGDVVSVARGYARNFLLPRKLAEEATDARVAELRKRDAQRARHEASTAELAEQQAAAPPESAPAEAVELLAEEIDAGPEDVAVESASGDFDETVEAAAENDEL